MSVDEPGGTVRGRATVGAKSPVVAREVIVNALTPVLAMFAERVLVVAAAPDSPCETASENVIVAEGPTEMARKFAVTVVGAVGFTVVYAAAALAAPEPPPP